jgi:pyrroloquinoline quinone (PQQ) biosynthesis protein C
MCLACQITQRMADVEGRLHPASSEWLWSELAVLRERYALGDHPYVVAWRRAELARTDLQLLATERDHVVVATAAALRRAGDVYPEAIALAEDEIHRWRRFAAATGWHRTCAWSYGEDPFPETLALARGLAGRDGAGAAETVARLYVLRIAHAEGDDRLTLLLAHALSAMPVDDPFAVLTAARETLEALWRFYDRLAAARVEVAEAAV